MKLTYVIEGGKMTNRAEKIGQDPAQEDHQSHPLEEMPSFAEHMADMTADIDTGNEDTGYEGTGYETPMSLPLDPPNDYPDPTPDPPEPDPDLAPKDPDYQLTGPEIVQNRPSQEAEPIQDRISPENDYSQGGREYASGISEVTNDENSQTPTPGSQEMENILKDLGIN